MTEPLTSAPAGQLLLLGDPAARPAGLERGLARAGYRITEAADVDGIADAGPTPAAILLVVSTTGQGLAEMLSRLARRTGWGAVSRIAIVADGNGEGVAAALRAGADDAVSATASSSELLARIAARLRHRPSGGDVERFRELLDTEIARATRYSLSLAVVRLRVAGFGDWIATLGERGADHLAEEIEPALRSVLRVPDSAVRLGRADYAVLLPETDQAGARTWIGRFRLALEHHAFEGGHRPAVQAGVAALPDPLGGDAAGLLERALHDSARSPSGPQPAATSSS
jgi:PleD family two-component response regulator